MEELQPGGVVRVRSRQYLVEDVIRSRDPREDTRVRLPCLDDDAQGQHLEVLWESEVDEKVLTASTFTAKAKFDDPARFASTCGCPTGRRSLRRSSSKTRQSAASCLIRRRERLPL